MSTNKDSAKLRRAKKPRRKRKSDAFVLTDRERAIVESWESAFALSPKLTALIDSCGVATVYERLSRHEYMAVKDGQKTQILVSSIKERRSNLPRAEFKPLPLRTSHQAAA
jgi:hypothetical protein